MARFNASGIPFLSGTRVLSGDAAAQTLLMETAEGASVLRFDKLILATGSRELFLPFPGWTLPGVFGAGGLQALAKSGLPVRGKRIVIGGTGPLLIAVGRVPSARRRRSEVDRRTGEPNGSVRVLPGKSSGIPKRLCRVLGLACAIAGIPYRTNCWVEAAAGRSTLERVTLRQGGRTWTEDCDYAADRLRSYTRTMN